MTKIKPHTFLVYSQIYIYAQEIPIGIKLCFVYLFPTKYAKKTTIKCNSKIELEVKNPLAFVYVYIYYIYITGLIAHNNNYRFNKII